MIRRILAFLVLPAALWAQSGPASGTPAAAAQLSGPGYSQLYCSGFITRKSISRANFVLGSQESPHEVHFAQDSTLFLRGADLVPGQRYSLVRQVADPNREDSSPEQRKKLASLGGLYEDIGWVTVKSAERGTAIASFDFSCTTAIPGDLVVPFQERPQFTFRNPEPPLDAFRFGGAAVQGHIVGSRDFDSLLGAGQIVYTDFGSARGAEPGDYLVISRGYAPGDLNKMDRGSLALPQGSEATAVNPAELPRDDSKMPNHILGELLILNVSRDASTALITRTASEVELGDVVQLEGAPNQAEGAQADSSEAAAACRPASRLHRMLFWEHGCKGARN